MKLRPILACLSLLGVMGCGGTSLDEPEDLVITEYAAGNVTVTFVMTTCSDVCSDYGASDCSVSRDGNRLEIDVEVSVDDKEGIDRDDAVACPQMCGEPVLAHCDLGDLEPGNYTLIAGDFNARIHVLGPAAGS